MEEILLYLFSEFLEKLKFGIGDGNLQYYLYNWRCPKMDPTKIGEVFFWHFVSLVISDLP